MKPDSKINYAFILTFLVGFMIGLLLFSLFSCEANKRHNFDCGVYYVTIYTPCPVVVILPRTLDNATYDQMHDYEQAYDCHCLPAVCPEY